MNNSLQAKLDQLLDRYEELAALLSDSTIIADQDKFRLYSKEYADIEPVVICFRQYEDQSTQLEDARQMLEDSDSDIREMAEAEILKAYLPEKLSEEEVRLMIANIIDETGANTLKDMGSVMAKLKEQADGKIDMKSASQIVRESLS